MNNGVYLNFTMNSWLHIYAFDVPDKDLNMDFSGKTYCYSVTYRLGGLGQLFSVFPRFWSLAGTVECGPPNKPLIIDLWLDLWNQP